MKAKDEIESACTVCGNGVIIKSHEGAGGGGGGGGGAREYGGGAGGGGTRSGEGGGTGRRGGGGTGYQRGLTARRGVALTYLCRVVRATPILGAVGTNPLCASYAGRLGMPTLCALSRGRLACFACLACLPMLISLLDSALLPRLHVILAIMARLVGNLVANDIDGLPRKALTLSYLPGFWLPRGTEYPL
ncbi:hypothetical protein ANTPLA_LOCUS9354 [Anthophora plagiata]